MQGRLCIPLTFYCHLTENYLSMFTIIRKYELCIHFSVCPVPICPSWKYAHMTAVPGPSVEGLACESAVWTQLRRSCRNHQVFNWSFRYVSLSAGGRMDFSIYLWKCETIGNWMLFEKKVYLLNSMSFAT